MKRSSKPKIHLLSISDRLITSNYSQTKKRKKKFVIKIDFQFQLKSQLHKVNQWTISVIVSRNQFFSCVVSFRNFFVEKKNSCTLCLIVKSFHISLMLVRYVIIMEEDGRTVDRVDSQREVKPLVLVFCYICVLSLSPNY